MKTIQGKLSPDDKVALSRAIASAFTIQRRDYLDEFYNNVPSTDLDKDMRESKIFNTDSEFVKRAHIDGWTLWLIMSRVDG